MKSLLQLLGAGEPCEQTQKKLDALYRNLPVLELSPQGAIINASSAVEALTGYSQQELRAGGYDTLLIEGDKNSSDHRQLWDSLRQGQTYTGEIQYQSKNHKRIWVKAAVTPIVESDGTVSSALACLTDITRLKADIEEGKKSANLANALKACQANVMLADNEFNIIYMNDTVTAMLSERETQLKQALPEFQVSTLIGKNVDTFHVNPGHQRKMVGALTKTYSTDIKVSGLTFGLIATPIFDAQGARTGTVVEWEDKTDRLAKEAEERRLAEENERIKQALNSVTTNVMIADKDAHIIYLNGAVESMMRTAETDIRKELPEFDAKDLLGKNIDVFHKNPQHQRNILKDLKGTYRGKASVGGRHFSVIATPVFLHSDRIGTVVEWADKTAELQMESEINSMVQAAASGDFTRQIMVEGKDGFFEVLAKGLNSLVSTVEVALNDILRMFGAMSKGDLSERVTREYMGAFGQLKDDANTTADKLTEIITKIRTSSAAILTAANEMSQGNTDLGQRTEEQAASLEETASSMEEMTSAVRQSADNAMTASALSEDAQKKATEGGAVVSKAIEAMDDIKASSKRINDIIGVIDEIAFQTNLLALNAAVEAARAGEQGRGFAVVAGEVRNLAQRSAEAAKEIKDLIRDSVSKVQDGSDLVNASGKTLGEIVASVENVRSMMGDVATAAQEQTSGIEQVNIAISQMDEMTQQNAALVEEASAAGAALAEQADMMNQVVAFFSVGGEGHQTSYASGGPASVVKMPNTSKTSRASATKPVKQASSNRSVSDDEWEEF